MTQKKKGLMGLWNSPLQHIPENLEIPKLPVF